MLVRDGELATIASPELGSFGFRPTVRDHESGLVTLALLEGTSPDGRMLDEVELRTGQSPVLLGTTPQFNVAVSFR